MSTQYFVLAGSKLFNLLPESRGRGWLVLNKRSWGGAYSLVPRDRRGVEGWLHVYAIFAVLSECKVNNF